MFRSRGHGGRKNFPTAEKTAGQSRKKAAKPAGALGSLKEPAPASVVSRQEYIRVG